VSDFCGDVLLVATPDGGDIVVTDGLVVSDTALSTAAYLSLFGGNKADNGKVKNSMTWWGNLVPEIKESEKMISRFQNIITAMPFSVKNIQAAEQAARLDFAWLIAEGIAERVDVSIRAVSLKKIEVKVDMTAGGDTSSKKYLFSWGGASDGIQK
jgi:phage gp46-like protein